MSHQNHHVVPGNGHHEWSRKKGYVAKEPTQQAYPKMVDSTPGHEVIVNSKEEEETYKAGKQAAEKEAE